MHPLDNALLHTLRVKHWLLSADLLQALGTSRPTLSRTLARLGDQVVSRGKARRTAYAARRALRGNPAPIPLFKVNEQGECSQIAWVDLTWPQGCALRFAQTCEWPLPNSTPSMQDGWFEGMPFFLDDMRPQGFLGRHFARQWASILQVSENPKEWSEDDVWHSLSLLGFDAPGCYILGEAAYRLFRQQQGQTPDGIDDDACATVYPQRAQAALQGGVAGTSAGGEFPKFSATRCTKGQTMQVLVKFSGTDDSPSSRRWSDLLVCEHLAIQTLQRQLGIASASSRLLQAGGRTFLEVERFDRHGAHGRSPVCSWQAINAAWLGMAGKPWSQAAERLLAQQLIDASTARAMARIAWYGQCIGNTDMHDGNLAFRPGSLLHLAPVYDMLPMQYAPQPGMEIVDREFAPRVPLPADRAAWHESRQAAVVFWNSVAAHPMVSQNFAQIALQNALHLRSLA